MDDTRHLFLILFGCYRRPKELAQKEVSSIRSIRSLSQNITALPFGLFGNTRFPQSPSPGPFSFRAYVATISFVA